MTTDTYAALVEIVGPKQVTAQTGGTPAWLVRPGSAAEVSELCRLANNSGFAVVPIGAATRTPQPAGPLPDRARLHLDMKRMDHVLHLDETSLVAHVQAGLIALELEKILVPRGLSLGDYPPATLRSTIGGLLAVRTPGKASSRHGFFEDAVIGLSAVLADGRTIHTRVAPRRATGPDLARVLCGSEGTIGIITSAVLRIHRRPESRLLATFALPSFEEAIGAVNLALREEAAPAALRICNALEARAQFGEDACGRDEALLLVATAGPTDLAACDRDLVASAVQATGGEPRDESIAHAWWKIRTGQAPLPDEPSPSLQISATPGKQVDVFRAVAEAARGANIAVRAYGSRFDVDGGVFFFTFLDASGAPVPDLEGQSMAEAASNAGAIMLGESNTTLAPYLSDLRRELDPKSTLNPGQLC